ncbi:lipopolysaccharide assembly protein LapA domain-containing protein [Thermodesulfobacteriota bacterium]
MYIKHVFILIFLVLFLVFIIQNMQIVEVQLLFWKVSMSRALMLLGTLVIGLIGGWFIKSFHFSRSK